MDPTYEIGTDENDNAYIKCLICERKSYHSKDIEHRYCGNCHRFHDPHVAVIQVPENSGWTIEQQGDDIKAEYYNPEEDQS